MKKFLASLFITLSFASTAAPAALPAAEAVLDAIHNDNAVALVALLDGGHFDVDGNLHSVGGQRPLHQAAWLGSFECVKVLLARSADVNVLDDAHCTPLHFAALEGRLALVQYLVNEAGADHEAQNRYRQIPKDLAIDRRYQDVVDFFNTLQELPITKGTEIGGEQ